MMKLARTGILTVVGLSLILSSALSFAGPGLEEFQRLNPAEQKIIEEGGQFAEFGNEKPWPSATIFQKMAATPEECAALFFDFGNQHNYIPNLLISSPIFVSKKVYDVDYQIKLPFLPAWAGGVETYRVRDELETYENADNTRGYLVKWNLIPGHKERMVRSDGEARFEEFNGATLLVYKSIIVPNNGLAWTVVGAAKDSFKSAVTSIVQEVAKEKEHKQDLLNAQVLHLREALAD